MNNFPLYRAKSVQDNKWVEGLLVTDEFGRYSIVGYLNHVKTQTLINPETIELFTWEYIIEHVIVNGFHVTRAVKVWEDDLIGIYIVGYGENKDSEHHLATVKVEWDDTYHMLFARCVKGNFDLIAQYCDFYWEGSEFDIPFSYWLEGMRESRNKTEWFFRIEGNTRD